MTTLMAGSVGPAVPNTTGIELNGRSTTLRFNEDGTVTQTLFHFDTRQTIRAERVTLADAAAMAVANNYPVIDHKPSWMP